MIKKEINHQKFDTYSYTSFVTTDQVLIILWHLKGAKYSFIFL